MANFEDVEAFLKSFHQKLKVFDIRFRNDRQKNLQDLLDLEITPLERRKIVESLTVFDFCDGPLADTLNQGAPMWVFGSLVKGKEVYIKISIGELSSPVICISFHLAQYQMVYPFKKG